MARRSVPPIGWLLALVLGVAMFSGCLSGGDSSAGPTGDASGDEPEETEQDSLSEALEPVAPFVEQLPEVLIGDGGPVGYVLENETLEPLQGVQVVAQCHGEGLSLPTGAQVATTDETGRFLFDAGGPLGACEEITYQAVEPGYRPADPLTSGRLEPGKQYFVVLTLEPIT